MNLSPSIQWFPGHMAKTRRMISDSLKQVDLVAELLDARIPYASANPQLPSMVGGKPRLVLLNKADYADPEVTPQWREAFRARGIPALAVDCRSGRGLDRFAPCVRETLSELLERRRAKGMQGAAVRIMIVGIPNVGKSSLINRLAGGRRAKVEDRPGVTRGRQWVSVENGMELLDMPGVLWPKFEDQIVAERLAFIGSVKDDVLDIESLAARLLEELGARYPEALCARYRMRRDEMAGLPGWELLELAGKKRGMLLSGGVADARRAAVMVIDEFRGGKIGRFTLERPEEA